MRLFSELIGQFINTADIFEVIHSTFSDPKPVMTLSKLLQNKYNILKISVQLLPSFNYDKSLDESTRKANDRLYSAVRAIVKNEIRSDCLNLISMS